MHKEISLRLLRPVPSLMLGTPRNDEGKTPPQRYKRTSQSPFSQIDRSTIHVILTLNEVKGKNLRDSSPAAQNDNSGEPGYSFVSSGIS